MTISQWIALGRAEQVRHLAYEMLRAEEERPPWQRD